MMSVEANLVELWQRMAARLRAELGEDLYSSWFGRMEIDAMSDQRLNVSVPTRFLKSWIENHYLLKLQKIAEAEVGPLLLVTVKVRNAAPQQRTVSSPGTSHSFISGITKPSDVNAASHSSSGASQPSPGLVDRAAALDDSQTFESFVVGHANQLAWAAASRVAQAQASLAGTANPLYVHAASGLGKTHLLTAIAQRIKATQPQRKVLMLTAERFMYGFIHAVRNRDTLAFKDQFNSVDVLLIDDFQFLQGKAIQQEFCHSFNSLVDSRRHVVVAADVPPNQLDSVDQRVRSRLMGGLVVDIEVPDADLRHRILMSRYASLVARDPTIHVPDDVLAIIASRMTGGGRELDGALNRIIAYQQLNHASITPDLAAMVLRDATGIVDGGRIKIEDIMKIIGRHYNVAKSDLLSPRRARTVVVPRQIGMYLAKKLTSRSLPEIGRRFGGRDHSTVLHAVRKIDDLIKVDEKLAKEVAMLIRLVEQA